MLFCVRWEVIRMFRGGGGGDKRECFLINKCLNNNDVLV